MMPVAEPKQGSKPWRRIGLAAAVVGTMGAAVGVAMRPKQLSPMERIMGISQDFMRGFAARKLTPLESVFACDATFKWVDEAETEDPSAMTIHAHLTQVAKGEAKPAPHINAYFIPKEGQSDKLLETFQAVIDAGAEFMKQKGGERQAAMVRQVVQVEKRGDHVVLVANGPPMPPKAEEEMEEGLGASPSFDATFSFGRDLGEIFENVDDGPLVMFNGIKGELHTSVAKKILAGVMEAGKGEGIDLTLMPILEAFSAAAEDFTIKYRKEELAAATSQYAMKVDALQYAAASVPESINVPLRKLHQFADGVEKVTLQGLPDRWEVDLNMKNFKITPLLTHVVSPPPEESA